MVEKSIQVIDQMVTFKMSLVVVVASSSQSWGTKHANLGSYIPWNLTVLKSSS